MNFSQLYNEVFDRGFHFLNDGGTGLTRVKRWVNEAYHELNEEDNWPWLEVTQAGTAPLTLTRARNVRSVVNTTAGVELNGTTREKVVDVFGAIPTTGNPRWYFVDHILSGTEPTLQVQIVPNLAAQTISVRYMEHKADLSLDADVPVFPSRFHWLIVNGALRRAHQDANQYDQAEVIEGDRRRGVEALRRWVMRAVQASPNLLDVDPVPMPDPTTGLPTEKGVAT